MYCKTQNMGVAHSQTGHQNQNCIKYLYLHILLLSLVRYKA